MLDTPRPKSTFRFGVQILLNACVVGAMIICLGVGLNDLLDSFSYFAYFLWSGLLVCAAGLIVFLIFGFKHWYRRHKGREL